MDEDDDNDDDAGAYDGAGEYDEYGFEGEEEDPGLTEMALIDHASRLGKRPQDLMMTRVDPVDAEEARDRAMRAFFDRQAARQPAAAAAWSPPSQFSGPAASPGRVSRIEALRQARERQEAEAAAAPGAAEATKPGPSQPDPRVARAVEGSRLRREQAIARRRQAASGAEPQVEPEVEPQVAVAPQAASRATRRPLGRTGSTPVEPAPVDPSVPPRQTTRRLGALDRLAQPQAGATAPDGGARAAPPDDPPRLGGALGRLLNTPPAAQAPAPEPRAAAKPAAKKPARTTKTVAPAAPEPKPTPKPRASKPQ